VERRGARPAAGPRASLDPARVAWPRGEPAAARRTGSGGPRQVLNAWMQASLADRKQGLDHLTAAPHDRPACSFPPSVPGGMIGSRIVSGSQVGGDRPGSRHRGAGTRRGGERPVRSCMPLRRSCRRALASLPAGDTAAPAGRRAGQDRRRDTAAGDGSAPTWRTVPPDRGEQATLRRCDPVPRGRQSPGRIV
jgi:hypothetical protein